MNRHRQGARNDRPGGRFMGNRGGGLGDGLLGEGPGMGGGGGGMGGAAYQDQLVNQQLMLAQSLLQQQQALNQLGLGGGHVGPDFHGVGDHMGSVGGLAGTMGSMQLMQQNRGFGMGGRMGGGGGGRLHDSADRKRMGQPRDRNVDAKRRRQDSTGRGGERDSRSRNKDSGRGGEGRDRNRTSRWDTDKKKAGNDDYDPAEPTDADEVGGGMREGKSKDGEGNQFCHVCNVSAYDDESFRRHLNGMKHKSRMSSLLTVHEMKSNQLKSRLKAEEHLRNIERKGGRDPEFFCKICNNDLTLPWKRHCFSNIHKQRLLQVRRGCGWCNVHNFNNFTEVLEHRETEQHKKNAEIYGKKEKESKDKDRKDRERRRSRSRDRKNEKNGSDRKDKKPKPKEEEEDLTIPEFDAEKPVGLNYIIPVTGFFCKLCLKFYNNEKSAKGAHCQSEGHYQKFKAATEAKIAAREKRKAEEAEEEAKRKEEEEQEKADQKEENMEEGDEEIKDENKEEGGENGDHETSNLMDDDEDYDDELPLHDEDGEGGNINPYAGVEDDDDSGLLHPDQSVAGAFLDDTNADASFEFLSGDMAHAHLELQKAEQILMEQQKEKSKEEEEQKSKEEEEQKSKEEEQQPQQEEEELKEVSEGLDESTLEGNDDADLLAEVPASDISADISQETEEPSNQEPESSQEVEPEVETPVVAKATARRGTARRGRGRGRGKK